jgi:hypothetical protein
MAFFRLRAVSDSHSSGPLYFQCLSVILTSLSNSACPREIGRSGGMENLNRRLDLGVRGIVLAVQYCTYDKTKKINRPNPSNSIFYRT